jgi:hypothetical protein
MIMQKEDTPTVVAQPTALTPTKKRRKKPKCIECSIKSCLSTCVKCKQLTCAIHFAPNSHACTVRQSVEEAKTLLKQQLVQVVPSKIEHI